MDPEEAHLKVKQAKSKVEDVKRGLSSLTSYIDMNSQYGSYVYSQLNSLKSKLDDADSKLRRAMRELES
jgi:multidrug resistance efflux pump